jgi:hypothetical protein
MRAIIDPSAPTATGQHGYRTTGVASGGRRLVEQALKRHTSVTRQSPSCASGGTCGRRLSIFGGKRKLATTTKRPGAANGRHDRQNGGSKAHSQNAGIAQSITSETSFD